MGTLYSQLERKSYRVSDNELDSFVGVIIKLSKEHGISVSDVIAAAHVLEIERSNNLYVANGNVFDEQIAGIGEEVQKISVAIDNAR